jgi:hypothetical protein
VLLARKFKLCHVIGNVEEVLMVSEITVNHVKKIMQCPFGLSDMESPKKITTSCFLSKGVSVKSATNHCTTIKDLLT